MPSIPTELRCGTSTTLSASAATRESTRPDVNLDGDDPALIIYTSGTTGAAKGAVLSHNNLAANGITLSTVWRITEADRYLAMLPLFHVHGLGNGIHSWLISGCRMRLVERFDHRTTPGVMAEFKPTLFFGVPTIYVRLLDPAVVSDDRSASNRGERAPLRFRIGAAAGARARGVSPALRPHDPRALRHERGADDHEQSVRGRTAARRGRTSAARRLGAHRRRERERARRRCGRRSGDSFAAPLLRVLAATRRHGRRVPRRLVSHRRRRHSFRRRLLHAARPSRRPDHQRRVQHLSARDRGVAARGSARARSGGDGRARRRSRRGSDRVHRRRRRPRRRRARGDVPRAARVVQGAARVRADRRAAAHRARQGAEAPPSHLDRPTLDDDTRASH